MTETLKMTLDRKWYPNVSDRWDDTLFRERILSVISSESVVLDLGAGAGIIPAMNFRGEAKTICGVDPDPRVKQNSYLDEGKVGLGEAIPYPDNSFDVVFSDNVLEHLEHPLTVFKEVSRVLKPGGIFLAKTPNRYHYMPVIATLTPHWFHQFIIRRIMGRKEVDTFPTRYRANSPGKIKKLAEQSGLSVSRIELIESRPEYLRFNPVTYFIGYLYERAVNKFSWLRRFRILMVVELKRDSDMPRIIKGESQIRQTDSEPMPGRSSPLRQSAPTHHNRRPKIGANRTFGIAILSSTYS